MCFVQIKLKLILKLTGNGLVMRWSHNTAAISPKKVQIMTLNMWSSPRSGKWGLLIVHILLPALQQWYSGSGVQGPIMLLIGHCNSSKNNLPTDASLWGFMSYNKTYLNLCMQLFLLHLGNYFAISNFKALSL